MTVNENAWDEGTLGRDEQYVRVSLRSDEVDDELGLQLISIRLQKKLINDLKAIAEFHEIGYQPMIRDLLNRFAECELKNLLNKRVSELKLEQATNKTEPVDAFMQANKVQCG